MTVPRTTAGYSHAMSAPEAAFVALDPNSFHRPIFIGGLMKSGSSLLRVLLGRHPRIFASFETHWFALGRESESEESTRRRTLLKQLYEVSDVDFAKLEADASSPLDFIGRFMEYSALRAGKKRWVEKTPDNLLYLDTIFNEWPEATFLHVARDLRDVFASWKKNQKAGVDSFVENAFERYQAVSEWRDSDQAGNYAEVAYERLVNHPETVMRELLGRIGEPWDPRVASTEPMNDEYSRVLEVAGVASSTAASLKRPIFTDSIGQWRQVLTPAEARRIEQALGRWMASAEADA